MRLIRFAIDGKEYWGKEQEGKAHVLAAQTIAETKAAVETGQVFDLADVVLLAPCQP